MATIAGFMVVFRWATTGRIDAAGVYRIPSEARLFGASVGAVIAVVPVIVPYEPGQIPADAYDRKTTR